MDSNPYTPPRAALDDPARLPGSIPKAVLFGVLVDVGGTTAISMLFGIVYAGIHAANGSTPEEITAALEGISLTSGMGLVLALAGFSFSVLGGFVCARTHRRADYRPALIVAALNSVIGVAMSFNHYSLHEHAGMALLSTLCVLLGAYLGRPRRVLRRS